ncbi:VWA domain-containing protein [Methylotuvimicrobium sp. KM1]|uniref:vWA domain-containing protein n=1 Tax=Methylotuvimicrobium sp. KM1 TaxID=3377707 RepID=UPI00384D4396
MMKNSRQTQQTGKKRFNGAGSFIVPVLVLMQALFLAGPANAGGYGFAAPGGYGVKVYRVNYALYPFVQLYIRTFDQNMQPLVNLNEMNIGLMIKGKSYDPMKRQYGIQSIRNRSEATRSVLVIDASKSMAGTASETALRAAARFIDSKRPQDEVAILAIRDTKEGYDLVSQFERDAGALARRLADIRIDGMKSRIYDSIGAAIQMCGMSAQGSSVDPSADNVIASCSVVVFSDGRDEGSALSREELNGRITSMRIPIPVYSLAYGKSSVDYFRNLESISKNSFGIYYSLGETYDKMQRIVEEIQNILQSDYVVTFRSYIPVDGEQHSFKVGIEYPTGSGKYYYDNGQFEAIEPPPIQAIDNYLNLLNQKIPRLPDNDPFYNRPSVQ